MCATTKQNQTKQEEKEMQDFMYERDTGHDPLTLEKVLDLMGNNFRREATYLIPDLQRKYVWSSKKIINLLDTLLKGWPFGQILVANTGKMSPMFAPRTFFSRVVMFGEERGDTMNAEMHADNATLVLDGQQRLQSLFLALAPSSSGLVQDQRTWISEYTNGKEYRLRWGYKAPPAFLSLNLENLCAAYDKEHNLSRLDYSAQAKLPIIEWVFKNVDNADGQMWQRRSYLPKLLVNPWGEDNFDKNVLLQDIWYADNIEKLENEHHIDVDIRPAFEAFCERLRGLKKVPVPHLCVLSREKCGLSNDEYNEMILSIFTRLNAGGEPLTEEEITYSWIKRYWPRDDIKATKVLDDLRNALAKRGIPLKSATLIRILSCVWSVFERGGKELSVTDMLDGELLKRVSSFLGNNWESIADQFVNMAEMLKKHELCYGRQYYSLQCYELMVTWSIIGKIWQNQHSEGRRAAEHLKVNPLFGEWKEERLDRFVFACQWANSRIDYFVELSKLQEDMKRVEAFADAKLVMSNWFEKHLQLYVKQAKRNVKDLNRTSRAGVSAYTTQLWCWQRLTKKRKELSNNLAKERDGVTTGNPNVDHCVSCAFWENYLGKFPEYPKGSDIYNEMMAKINQIGNCNILCKYINCSKSSVTMSMFWKAIGFRVSDVEALNIPEEMFNPDKEGLRPELIMHKIEERTKLIRKDLCAFLDGEDNVFIHR